MKRRSFLKGLAALALAPTAALASTSTSPAKTGHLVKTPTFEGMGPIKIPDGVREKHAELMKRCAEAMRKQGEATDKARKAAEEMRKSLEDIYISPEAIDDIRQWGVDQVDETTRKEIFADPEPRRAGFYAWSEQGGAVMDSRRILLTEF